MQREGVFEGTCDIEHWEFAWLLKRFVHTYWQSVEFNLGRIVVSLVLGLVFGLAFGSTNFATCQGVNTVAALVGLYSAFLGVVAFDGAIPFAFPDRAAYYRERVSQTYNSLWYCVCLTLIEIPDVLTIGLKIVGQAISFATSSVEIATTFGLFMTTTSFLFMGFNPPSGLIPTGHKWLNAIVASKYTMTILTSVIFGDCSSSSDLGCHQIKDALPTLPTNITSVAYLDQVFLIRYGDLWVNCAVIQTYISVVRVLAILALRYVRHEAR